MSIGTMAKSKKSKSKKVCNTKSLPTGGDGGGKQAKKQKKPVVVDPESTPEENPEAEEVGGIEVVERTGDDDMVIDIVTAADDDDGSDDDDDDDDDDDNDDDANDSDGDDSSGKVHRRKQTQTQSTTTTQPPMPFMDTFYSLSSPTPAERTLAAHCLLRHCFPKPTKDVTNSNDDDVDVAAKVGEVNLPDATYAFTRLLDGLNSGRASARQGYASALGSFVRLGMETDMPTTSGDDEEEGDGGVRVCVLEGIRREMMLKAGEKDGESSSSATASANSSRAKASEYVRSELLKRTSPSSDGGTGGKYGGNKKRGSEERDHKFGRLFGILAVVRSGTLLPLPTLAAEGEEEEGAATSLVIQGYASDLINLYHYKSWMREPAAHGLMELLTSISGGGTAFLFDGVVRNVVVPKLLLLSDNTTDDMPYEELVESFTAEQIGVCLHVQSLTSHRLSGGSDGTGGAASSMKKKEKKKKEKETKESGVTTTGGLPYPLNKALLTPLTVPRLATALRNTSGVVHPRCHLVWGAIWTYLTEEEKAEAGAVGRSQRGRKKNKKGSKRVLRKKLPLGDSTGESVVEAIVEEVVVKSLLGGKSSGGGADEGGGGGGAPPGGTTTTTHERRTLALTLVQILCGASPRLNLRLPSDVVEKVVLQPTVVERAFLNVLRTTSGGKSSEHTLKPLALHVLASIVTAATTTTESGDEDEDGGGAGLRLSVVKSFLRVEPRFDGVTKTDSVSGLLLAGGSKGLLWDEYLSFLEEQIFSSSEQRDAIGHVGNLFAFGKRVLRSFSPTGGEEEDEDDRANALETARRILGFFMAGAFFDLAGLSSGGGKKKKKKKKNQDHPALLAAQRIAIGVRTSTDDKSSVCVPYQIRVAMSSHFFSLLADIVTVAPSLTRTEGGGAKSNKAESSLETFSLVTQQWDELEKNGAQLFVKAKEGDEDSSFLNDMQALVKKLSSYRSEGGDDDNTKLSQAKSNAVTGCTSLLMALYLQILNPGSPDDGTGDDEIMDEGEEDMDDILEEVLEMVSDLTDITKGLLAEGSNDEKDADEDSENEEKPLASFAELCVNILSSSIGSDAGKSKTRGGAAKFLRDCVKSAWTLGLNVATAASSADTDDDDCTKNSLDKDVMAILLEAVCGPAAMQDYSEEAEGGDDDAEMNSDEEEKSGDDDGVFTAATSADLDMGDSDEDDNEEGDSDKKDDDSDSDQSAQDDENKEDVELDPEQLENLLLQDSDGESNGGELEHHAGADKALAQLIKMKQDARKAGQKERERIEISNRLRCIVLLEAVFSSASSSGTGVHTLMKEDVVLMSILPLLRARLLLEKAVHASASLAGAKKNIGLSEKKALVARLSDLLQKKVYKVRLLASSSESEDEDEFREARSVLANKIMDECRKSVNASHCSCCSLSLILTMKSLSQDEANAVAIARHVYGDAVEEWSIKKSTKLNVCLFEDLAARSPSLARAVLTEPLSNATENARSAFLKSESFRILSILYNVAQSDDSALAGLGMTSLKSVASSVASSIESGLHDDGLLKAKRVRDVLKASEQLVAFSSQHCKSDGDLWGALKRVSDLLCTMSAKTNSQGVKKTCEKIVQDISIELKACNELQGGDAVMEDAESSKKTHATSSSKKKKKKKKSKK